MYIHGGAILLRDVRCRKILDGKSWSWGAVRIIEWEAVRAIYEQFGGSRVGAGAQVSMTFPVLSLGVITGLGLGLGYDGPASQGDLRPGGHQRMR
jgi:hypothetical protein